MSTIFYFLAHILVFFNNKSNARYTIVFGALCMTSMIKALIHFFDRSLYEYKIARLGFI